MAFHILIVCTGNVCRSPMAERLLAARLGESAGVTVSSAGTRALAGYAMDAPSAAVLRELGGDPTGHVARQLGPDELASADLVLATDSANRGIVVRERPAVLHRAFTLREFVRLAAGADPSGAHPDGDELRARVAEVAARRGLAEPHQPGADEIGDPFGAPLPVVRACGEQVSAAVDGLLAGLGLGR